jgi:bifunctional UDP-N-acetylglucosamine pyrophosphorylase/glucosamine-1-phosphate N-acetyltransferase
VVVLSGDVPLTQADTLRALVAPAPAGAWRCSRHPARPHGLWPHRAQCRRGAVQGIVEHKDATEAQRAITEVYSGIMAVPARLLKGWLARLTNHNAQGEYYLTDVVKPWPWPTACPWWRTASRCAAGGGREQPPATGRTGARTSCARRGLMEQGVRLADPARFDLRDDARTGVRGDWSAARTWRSMSTASSPAVWSWARACASARTAASPTPHRAGAVIHPFTHIDGEKAGATVGEGALVGPFARLRPGAQLGREVHIGNFVEVKNSTLADGAKANHLAYLGDATVGERVNYGAGSITANYDGANKHRTVIEADVHIGSNCVLVAPVTIGAGGTVGGGSTITKSTPPVR